MQKQWTEMLQDEKLDYLLATVRENDAPISDISKGAETQIMRLDKRIEELEKRAK